MKNDVFTSYDGIDKWKKRHPFLKFAYSCNKVLHNNDYTEFHLYTDGKSMIIVGLLFSLLSLVFYLIGTIIYKNIEIFYWCYFIICAIVFCYCVSYKFVFPTFLTHKHLYSTVIIWQCVSCVVMSLMLAIAIPNYMEYKEFKKKYQSEYNELVVDTAYRMYKKINNMPREKINEEAIKLLKNIYK